MQQVPLYLLHYQYQKSASNQNNNYSIMAMADGSAYTLVEISKENEDLPEMIAESTACEFPLYDAIERKAVPNSPNEEEESDSEKYSILARNEVRSSLEKVTETDNEAEYSVLDEVRGTVPAQNPSVPERDEKHWSTPRSIWAAHIPH